MSEIRGHRRTYIGAIGQDHSVPEEGRVEQSCLLPGRGGQTQLRFRGDPSSRSWKFRSEQNVAFNDNYLDVDYDLSDFLFFTTADILQTIPAPLQDRMEVIRIAGYTEQEKMHIAQRFLLTKEMEANGLKEANIEITNGALLRISRQYNPGSRRPQPGKEKLPPSAGRSPRKSSATAPGKKIVISSKNIPKYLGVPKFRHAKRKKRARSA
jgi:ATP-dependent Lon protease